VRQSSVVVISASIMRRDATCVVAPCDDDDVCARLSIAVGGHRPAVSPAGMPAR